MINFACEHCQAQLTFEDALGGSKGLCPHCKELIYIPKLNDAQKGIRVTKSSFSAGARKYLQMKVSDIDDDPTDNKFLVPEEKKSRFSEDAQRYIEMKVSDIDDDPTDNKFLTAEERKSSFSQGAQKFLKKLQEKPEEEGSS